MTLTPNHLELHREKGLHITWDDDSETYYPAHFLRKMSPSADAQSTRDELKHNPLAILPSTNNEPLSILDAELVGNYAVRFTFSDGHTAGIYSWKYLQSLTPDLK